MRKASVLVQIVLADGDSRQVERMLSSLDRAVEFAHDQGMLVQVDVCMSDCSRAQVPAARVASTQSYDWIDIKYKFSSTVSNAQIYNLAAQNVQVDHLVFCSAITVFPADFFLLLPGWLTDPDVACAEVRTIPWGAQHDFDAETGTISCISDSCLVFKSSIFTELGGFDDQHFPQYRSMIDLSIRLRSNQYRAVYISDHSVFQEPVFPDRGDDDLKGLGEVWENWCLLYKFGCDSALERLQKPYQESSVETEKKLYLQFFKYKQEHLLPLPMAGISSALQLELCALCGVPAET
ncbi:hypothetical protein H8K20_07220 [Neobittarella massiliensis]|uniref:Uncharacterized protein n=1 Tax=Neobittarella massiliensis (ex Bilen et al. 2018) TaxID=2041842 RepID=A0A8J6LZ23_9FIRM|nr:hypothetical protein [Neobittarella massiliensis]MBC3516183.1 hypothetical protein [Neobittarella massiliensis]